MSNLEAHRSLVFAGIRRAALVARQQEELALHYAWESDTRAFACRMSAQNIRLAIRAAIGSENR